MASTVVRRASSISVKYFAVGVQRCLSENRNPKNQMEVGRPQFSSRLNTLSCSKGAFQGLCPCTGAGTADLLYLSGARIMSIIIVIIVIIMICCQSELAIVDMY